MKKITLILVFAAFATQSFAHCPIPQWCPDAPLHQTLCPGEQIEDIEFPSVIGRTLIITWWTDGTRIHSFENPPSGITVSGDASTSLGDREYAWPVSIKGAPTTPGTHHYTVSNTCGVELLHGSITLNASPTIGMITPTGDQTTWQNVPFDYTLSINPVPIGTPTPTVQWYSNTTATPSGGLEVISATENTLAPPVTTVDAAGVYYYAIATNSCGSAITSNVSGLHTVIDFLTSISCTGAINSGTFGAVSWGGNADIETQTWTVGSQVWSDAVSVTNCDKTSWIVDNNMTECRNATNGFHGHYFTWCFVMRYADQLCPEPWRVPITDDFANLHTALGYSLPALFGSVGIIANTYMGTSGSGIFAVNREGTWGGSSFTAVATSLTDEHSGYWSSSELSTTTVHALGINRSLVWPQGYYEKHHGVALRCVRDN
ncbi:MAG: fibrobacter succinogenes major paralogous domain-containing protein [Bacteroidales bacterium]|nr:fibrobacter succinogenes major paralogous domain-containing protein [Bacteroidales bacterium]